MRHINMTRPGKLKTFIPCAFYILVFIGAFIDSYHQGITGYEYLAMCALFTGVAYFRHAIVNRILGTLMLGVSLYMYLEVGSDLRKANYAATDTADYAALFLITASVVMSVVLSLSGYKRKDKQIILNKQSEK